ncbi:MAG: DUF2271 domain-containing protein [Candidatus Krumholzibacteriales bacterium]
MRKVVFTIAILVTIASAAGIFAGDISQYIMEAEKHREEGRLDEAVALLQEVAGEHPDNSTLISYLGLYTGMSAGNTSDFAEAGRLASESFTLLDRAVSLDPDNPEALMNRGIIYVNVPQFLGKLDRGIKDLEKTAEIFAESPEVFSAGKKAAAWNLLAEGYSRKGDREKAAGAWKEVIAISPGSREAEQARTNIEKLEKEAEERKKVGNTSGTETAEPVTRGKEAYLRGDYSRARELLEEAVKQYPANFEVNKYLGLSFARLAEAGYDQRIKEDTNLRTTLVMESVKYLDKAVELRPDDMELRFTRGSLMVFFPFFTGRSDQGIADLEMVLESGLPDSVKAETHYLLGVGYRKKGTHHWIEGTVKYPESEAARRIYGEMKPDMPVSREETQENGSVRIDFVMGYQDELPPQTAVWIEDDSGNYIRTIYVSGFSGHVRDRQVVLPVWAEASGFQGIDAVTGASIDTGRHTCTWNLEDAGGNRVGRGNYMVKVEASFWPSYKYQAAEAKIRVGRRKDHIVVEEGNFIPWLKVTYLPE